MIKNKSNDRLIRKIAQKSCKVMYDEKLNRIYELVYSGKLKVDKKNEEFYVEPESYQLF